MEGRRTAGFDVEDGFISTNRLVATFQDLEGVSQGFAGGKVVGTVADGRLEQGKGLRRGEPRQWGRVADDEGDGLSATPRSRAASRRS